MCVCPINGYHPAGAKFEGNISLAKVLKRNDLPDLGRSLLALLRSRKLMILQVQVLPAANARNLPQQAYEIIKNTKMYSRGVLVNHTKNSTIENFPPAIWYHYMLEQYHRDQ